MNYSNIIHNEFSDKNGQNKKQYSSVDKTKKGQD